MKNAHNKSLVRTQTTLRLRRTASTLVGIKGRPAVSKAGRRSLEAIEINAFVPARDFDLSLQFYPDLGFEAEVLPGSMVCLYVGKCSFLLQRFHVKETRREFHDAYPGSGCCVLVATSGVRLNATVSWPCRRKTATGELGTSCSMTRQAFSGASARKSLCNGALPPNNSLQGRRP